jgi:hypothetical protein
MPRNPMIMGCTYIVGWGELLPCPTLGILINDLNLLVFVPKSGIYANHICSTTAVFFRIGI